LKLKNLKNSYIKTIYSILNRAHLPITNTIIERTLVKKVNVLSSQDRDPKILSHLSDHKNLDKFLTKLDSRNIDKKNQNIHDLVYNSINYKNMGGIRVEIKGRLTKRYRADRAISFVK
jgi:hypothetical protein